MCVWCDGKDEWFNLVIFWVVVKVGEYDMFGFMFF